LLDPSSLLSLSRSVIARPVSTVSLPGVATERGPIEIIPFTCQITGRPTGPTDAADLFLIELSAYFDIIAPARECFSNEPVMNLAQ